MPDGSPGQSPGAKRPIVAPPPLNDGPRYGRDRFHSPRRYECAHPGCTGAASTLARAGDHEVVGIDGGVSTRAHNCCGGTHEHQRSTEPSIEKD